MIGFVQSAKIIILQIRKSVIALDVKSPNQKLSVRVGILMDLDRVDRAVPEIQI